MTICCPIVIPVTAVTPGALLHFDGADDSTSVTDERGHTWTVSSIGVLDDVQKKFGPTAWKDHIITGDGSNDLAFGSGDFTIDFWARHSSVSGFQTYYDSRPLGVDGFYPTIYLDDTSNTVVYVANSGSIAIGSSTALVIDTWYHIAVTRASGTTRLFINGTQEASVSDSSTYLNGSSRPLIGASGNDLGSGFLGWLDELRVMKGVAAWSGNFTPPVAPYT